MVLTALNFSISFVAFGEIAESFDAEETTVSWALTAFSITIGALIVPGGWAADRYGRSRMFVAGFSVFLLGSGLVALAPSVELLVAARVVQASGVAFQSPAMLALMLDAFGPDRRATSRSGRVAPSPSCPAAGTTRTTRRPRAFATLSEKTWRTTWNARTRWSGAATACDGARSRRRSRR